VYQVGINKGIGRCVEFDEVVYMLVVCSFILCLFVLLCCCNVHISEKTDIHK